MFWIFVLSLILVHTQFGRALTDNLLQTGGEPYTPEDLEDLERHLESRLADLEDRLDTTELTLTRERAERRLGE